MVRWLVERCRQQGPGICDLKQLAPTRGRAASEYGAATWMRLPLGLAARAASAVLLLLGALLSAQPCHAGGPPFITDDPEPVEYHHWEVYAASQRFRDAFGSTGTLPHLEANFGVAPSTQLHLIAPLAFASPTGDAMQYGLGDIELGVKWRFLQETRSRPQIGTFPLVEVPTGDAGRGLGNGAAQVFLPVWLQKSWGTWTTYGGGGYWVNPGPGDQDFWYVGWLLQRSITRHLTTGAELFHATTNTVSGMARTGANLGLICDFDEGHHLLFSVGDDFRGPGRGMMYLAYQWTFGPRRGADGRHDAAAWLRPVLARQVRGRGRPDDRSNVQ